MKYLSRNKNKLLLFGFFLFISFIFVNEHGVEVSAISNVYYVDSVYGMDGNDGKSASTPWKTLGKVNDTTFAPGDVILLKSGCVWNGEQLWPKGSGVSGSPIVIDKYGTGSNPVINGMGLVTETVLLYNQQYWEIKNLEITNDAADASVERRGVLIGAQDIGICNHIYLINLNIHNVKSKINDMAYTGGGIIMLVTANPNPDLRVSTRFNDIFINNCTISTVDRTGIFLRNIAWRNRGSTTDGVGPWNGFTNVVISNNVLNDIGCDGIVTCDCDGPIVQYNLCKDAHKRSSEPGCGLWPINCNNAVYQYNEVYLTRGTKDGQGLNADGMCYSTIMQYNYSHDNEGGFMLLCNWTEQGSFNNDGIIRYNISQNDRRSLFYFSGFVHNFNIYNNTFYVRSGLSTSPIIDKGYNGSNAYFYNNIFYNLGTGGSGYKFDKTSAVFDYNCFYGVHPSNEPYDAHKLTSNPLFVNPGTGGVGRSTADGYKLQANSPCINSGMTTLSDNGGKDFWGNSAPYASGHTDRGAFEYPLEWTASVGFSSVQGANQWYYKQWNGSAYSDMTWNSANGYWTGSTAYTINGSNWLHPDTNDAVKAWVAPIDGMILITGNPKKTNIGGGDGVAVLIKKNYEILLQPTTILYDDTTGITHNITTNVSAGDVIYFIVNQRENNWYDNTYWDPSIHYLS